MVLNICAEAVFKFGLYFTVRATSHAARLTGPLDDIANMIKISGLVVLRPPGELIDQFKLKEGIPSIVGIVGKR
jgi:hypothetical protein